MNNNMAEYLFHRGENFHAYEYLGSFIKRTILYLEFGFQI